VVKSVAGTAKQGTSRAIMESRFLGVGVWISVLLLGLFYFWQQVHYWNNLALGYADCAEHASLFYNTICNPHELFLSVNPTKPMFWDHFYPGLVVLTPLWLLWPSLKMIIALQIVCILGASLPLTGSAGRFSRKGWRHFARSCVAHVSIDFTIHLQRVVWVSHREYLPAAILYCTGMLAGGRPRWALATAIWAMLIKEEAAIVVGMFGLYLALFERRRAAGLALTVFAFGFFLLVTALVIPR